MDAKKKKSIPKQHNKKEPTVEHPRYWDEIADDAASGFRSDQDTDDLLNTDQLPDDHERGDAVDPEEKNA